jgi:hypothetical protein
MEPDISILRKTGHFYFALTLNQALNQARGSPEDLRQDDWLTSVLQANSSECEQSECCRGLQQVFLQNDCVANQFRAILRSQSFSDFLLIRLL